MNEERALKNTPTNEQRTLGVGRMRRTHSNPTDQTAACSISLEQTRTHTQNERDERSIGRSVVPILYFFCFGDWKKRHTDGRTCFVVSLIIDLLIWNGSTHRTTEADETPKLSAVLRYVSRLVGSTGVVAVGSI